MVDPVIAGAAVTAAGIAAAAGYSYFTGNDSSVDTDGDGEAELEFGGGNGVTGCNDPTEDPAYAEDPAPAFETTEQPEDPTPEAVEAKDGLEDVKGVGGTRAEDLADEGFETPADLYYASDENLLDVHGIGDLTVSQIREDIGSVEDEGNDGESTEEAEADSQDSEDQTQDDEASSSTETSESTSEDTAESDESDGSDSEDQTETGSGNESDDEQ